MNIINSHSLLLAELLKASVIKVFSVPLGALFSVVYDFVKLQLKFFILNLCLLLNYCGTFQAEQCSCVQL